MVGIYFSGTGNSRYCAEQLVHTMEAGANCIAIEDPYAVQAIKQEDFLILAYPVYFSNLPKIMRDFLDSNSQLFFGKKVFIIATMGLFSGDGTGCAARLLKKYGAKIVGGSHIKMPDSIGDEKLLKKTKEENKKLVKQAQKKIEKVAQGFESGVVPQEGLSFLSRVIGFLGQRLWFYNKTKHYSNKLKINTKKCVGCGVCVKLCPMENLVLEQKIAVSQNQCTMCYRCVSHCPQQAITLLGSKLQEQCKLENYL